MTHRLRQLLLTGIILIAGISAAVSQNIPLGTWRMHIAYRALTAIVPGNAYVYAAVENGVMVIDRDDQRISTWTKLTGLTGAAITTMAQDPSSGTLLIGYADGNLDIIQDDVLENFSRLADAAVTVSTGIRDIFIYDGLGYLATAYGVVVFDIAAGEVKETWRDLGEAGAQLGIYKSTVLGDSIFLATETGVLTGNLQDNLLDYENWKRFDDDVFNTPVELITAFQDRIYCAIDDDGLYYYEDGAWVKDSFLDGGTFHSLSGSTSLWVAWEDQLWQVSYAGDFTEVTADLIETPRLAEEDSDGNLWIGDDTQGLISNESGSYTSYRPNGPGFATATKLTYFNNTIYAVPGGYTEDYEPAGNAGKVSYFSEGQWTHVDATLSDLTDVAFVNNEAYVASFGGGVQRGALASPDVIYNEDNSSLISTTDDLISISAIEATSDGLWVANYGATSSLHMLSSDDDTWEAFSFSTTAARYPLSLAVDSYGSVWAVLNPDLGGGLLVFNRYNNEWVRLTEEEDAGGLPSTNALSIALDRSGYMWVGTEEGVAYYASPSEVFVSGINAVRPIFASRYLLTGEAVTAIAVDGGDRKWLGTENGVWLFNTTADEQIYNFTEENSPLLSNVIYDIAIDPKTGEVFFATEKGIVSYRSDASVGGTFKKVKIFPNPVPSGFSGEVGISGLATDAVVKITDAAGKLIWQTQANGGTATWDVHDYNGRRAATGVYFVFAATEDGGESFVGKVAVIE